MADPISILGITLQIGQILTQLYDYGKAVKSARKEIVSLCSELSALKNVLADLDRSYARQTPAPRVCDFDNVLRLTAILLTELESKLSFSGSSVERAVKALKWPFDSASVTEKMLRLERLKTWFLLFLMGDEKSAIDSLATDLNALTHIVQDDIATRGAQETSKANKRFLALIAPVSSEDAHQSACGTWAGTASGLWFCDGHLKPWIELQDSKTRVMTLMGKSGAGKTTIMSRAIETCLLSTTPGLNGRVAYSYCAYNNSASQECRSVLGSWVSQILQDRHNALQELRSTPVRPEGIPLDQLESSLINVANEDGDVVLILDAINESSESDAIVDSIARLVEGSSNIKVLLSSTPYCEPLIEKLSTVQWVDMAAASVAADMEVYIKRSIAKHRILRAMPETEIVTTLIQKSEGMFRWVDCQMTFLRSRLTARDVRDALNELPGTLNDTYAAMLQRVPEYDRYYAREVLLWLSFCLRPLTLAELAELVIIRQSDTYIDEHCRLPDPGVILSICQSLVVLDLKTNTVSLAHGSVRSFLVGDQIRNSSAAYFAMDEEGCRLHIVRRCLTYLLMDVWNQGRARKEELKKLKELYPAMDYISTRWANHTSQCTLLEDDFKSLSKFFNTSKSATGNGHFENWTCFLLGVRNVTALEIATPLYYSASYGITSVVTWLLSQGTVNFDNRADPWYLDYKSGRGRSTPLNIASYRGNLEVVQLLLDAGADPNAKDKDGWNSAEWALMRRQRRVLDLLIRHGGTVQSAANTRYRRNFGSFSQLARQVASREETGA